MLVNQITSAKIPVLSTIDSMLEYYGTNKEQIDMEFARSLDFDYKIIDTFESDSSGKAPQTFLKTATFVDCAYVNKDLY